MAQSHSISGDYTEIEVAVAESLMTLWRSWQPASAKPQPPVTVSHEEVVTSVPTEIKTNDVRVDSDVTKQLRDVIGDAIRRWRGLTAGADGLAADTVARISQEAALATVAQLEADNSAAGLNDNAGTDDRRPCSLKAAHPSTNRKNKENIRRSRGSLYVEDGEVKPCAKLVPIGEGNAAVPAYILRTMDWKRHKQATRTLLEHVFGRDVLATHNLTGKPSPAFPNRTPKGRLDPAMVRDIVHTVVAHSGVSASLVRSSITSKCADEGKGMNEVLRKKSALKKENY